MTKIKRGVGKCEKGHTGSFGYPTRPETPYSYCSQCGKEMVWQCPDCGEALPQDSAELGKARFCRECGSPYFGNREGGESEKP